jgi:hypothetical protein
MEAAMNAASIAVALARRRVQRLADGGYLVPCPLPSHGKGRGDRNPSLHIKDGDERLLIRCYAGCDVRDVLDELRRRGLLNDRDVEHRGPLVARNKKQTPQRRDEYTEQQHRKAAWLWSRRQPIGGTIAETYLRARGITCPLPATLGFLPPHKPEYDPALIAAFGLADEPEPGVLAPPRNVIAVHLTLLRPDGSSKADIDIPKLMVGSPGALPIVLAPVNDLGGLAITEGIEDALTAHQATGLGAWAAGAAGRMPALAEVIPRYVEAITIFAHNDEAGRRGTHGLIKNIRTISNDIEIRVEGLR